MRSPRCLKSSVWNRCPAAPPPGLPACPPETDTWVLRAPDRRIAPCAGMPAHTKNRRTYVSILGSCWCHCRGQSFSRANTSPIPVRPRTLRLSSLLPVLASPLPPPTTPRRPSRLLTAACCGHSTTLPLAQPRETNLELGPNKL